jgi:hypothetical protein
MVDRFGRFGATVCLALLLSSVQGCGPSNVPLDTLPYTRGQAGDLANSIASNASCENLEELDPAGTQGSWDFTCQRGDVTFDISIFGGDDARQAEVRQLAASGGLYVAKSYYAVTVAFPGAAGKTTPTLLDPFG